MAWRALKMCKYMYMYMHVCKYVYIHIYSCACFLLLQVYVISMFTWFAHETRLGNFWNFCLCGERFAAAFCSFDNYMICICLTVVLALLLCCQILRRTKLVWMTPLLCCVLLFLLFLVPRTLSVPAISYRHVSINFYSLGKLDLSRLVPKGNCTWLVISIECIDFCISLSDCLNC